MVRVRFEYAGQRRVSGDRYVMSLGNEFGDSAQRSTEYGV